MRKIRYAVVMSVDGYIAGPNGEADWIIHNPEIDFGATFNQFDTLFVGRRTFETMVHAGQPTVPGMKMFVFSKTLQQRDYPDVTIVDSNSPDLLRSIRAERGKDIWLFGGGSLFRSLLDAKLVDTVEVGIIPILLGGGILLLPSPADRKKLKLTSHKIYKTGIVSLEYTVEYPISDQA